MRRDPWQHREKYQRWKASVTAGITGLSAQSSAALLAYLADMEIGRNTAKGTRKGARSYPRLNNLRQRLIFLARAFDESFVDGRGELRSGDSSWKRSRNWSSRKRGVRGTRSTRAT